MRPLQTLADVIHAVTNSLSLISSHAQHLRSMRQATTAETEELQSICDAAERAAGLLGLVPQELAQLSIQVTTAASPGCETRREDSPPPEAASRKP